MRRVILWGLICVAFTIIFYRASTVHEGPLPNLRSIIKTPGKMHDIKKIEKSKKILIGVAVVVAAPKQLKH